MMPAFALEPLAKQCAPAVDLVTVQAVVRTESGGNPHAIGVVAGQLKRQPRSKPEALATARSLADAGRNFSVGLAQINQANFARLGLTLETAFDPCENLRAMQRVLQECWERSRPVAERATAIRGALSCYFSGTTDHLRYGAYVDSVIDHARAARAMRPAGQAP